MEYMKNSVINYNTYTSTIDGETVVSADYTSKDFSKLYSFANTLDTSYFKYIQAEDNSTFEQISYSTYGSTKYWDVIMLINKREAIYGLPVDYDTLSDLALNKANKYISIIRTITDARKNSLYDKYLSELVEQNEEKRTVKLILPERISEFLKLAKTEGII